MSPKFKGNVTARYSSRWATSTRTCRAHTSTPASAGPTCAKSSARSSGGSTAYSIFDFTAGIDNGTYSFELFVGNVFDERAEITRFAQCAEAICGLQTYVVTNPPRTFGAALRAEVLDSKEEQGMDQAARASEPPFLCATLGRALSVQDAAAIDGFDAVCRRHIRECCCARVRRAARIDQLEPGEGEDVVTILLGESAELADREIEWGEQAYVEQSGVDAVERAAVSNRRRRLRAAGRACRCTGDRSREVPQCRRRLCSEPPRSSGRAMRCEKLRQCRRTALRQCRGAERHRRPRTSATGASASARVTSVPRCERRARETRRGTRGARAG